jgi:pimeloyl-ACP methyl ester carboxylesterase
MTDMTIANGSLKLAASVHGPAAAEPVLFLHGMSQSRDTWEEIRERLADRYRIWTLDFRDHGHSDRSPSYDLAGYVSDAEAALATIGRPSIVVGHSLGACIAGILAQTPHPKVRGVFLEDPPWYLGQPGEWEQTPFPQLFAIMRARQAAWQQQGAPVEQYLEFLSTSPSPMGGVGRDHMSARHLLSHASALQRQDNRCWDSVMGPAGGLLAGLEPDRALRMPARVIQADPACGAALLDSHIERFVRSNPAVDVRRYPGCGHSVHRIHAFEQRFFDDLEQFIVTLPST